MPELSWGVLDQSRRIYSWRLNIESTGVLVGNCVGAVGQDAPPGMVPGSKLGIVDAERCNQWHPVCFSFDFVVSEN